MMSAFFTKAKPRHSASPSVSSIATTSQSDFEKMFKPFLVKKDVSLAPVNWFKAHSVQDVVILDEDIPSQEEGSSGLSGSFFQVLEFIMSSAYFA